MKDKYLNLIREQIKKAKRNAWKVIDRAQQNDPQRKGRLYSTSAAFLGLVEEDVLRPQEIRRKNSADSQRYGKMPSQYDTIGSSKVSGRQGNDNSDENCHLCLITFSRAFRLVKGRHLCKQCNKHVCKNCYDGKAICKACMNIEPLMKDIERSGRNFTKRSTRVAQSR